MGIKASGSAGTINFTNGNSNTVTIRAPILENSGTAVSFAGTGTTVLNGANTYTGATTIASGTLQLGTGSTTGTVLPGSTITDNGTLVFNRSGTITQGTDFSTAAISGTGGITLAGSATVIFNAAESYTGATTINAGTLKVGNLTSGSLSSSTALTMGGGTFSLVGNSSGSTSQTVASLTTTANTRSSIVLTPSGPT